MTDFIDFEVSVEDNNRNSNEEKYDEVSNSYLDSLKSFIDDDNDEIENDRTFFIKSLKT